MIFIFYYSHCRSIVRTIEVELLLYQHQHQHHYLLLLLLLSMLIIVSPQVTRRHSCSYHASWVRWKNIFIIIIMIIIFIMTNKGTCAMKMRLTKIKTCVALWMDFIWRYVVLSTNDRQICKLVTTATTISHSLSLAQIYRFLNAVLYTQGFHELGSG